MCVYLYIHIHINIFAYTYITLCIAEFLGQTLQASDSKPCSTIYEDSKEAAEPPSTKEWQETHDPHVLRALAIIFHQLPTLGVYP